MGRNCGRRVTAVNSANVDTVRPQREILAVPPVEPPVRLLTDVAREFGVAAFDYHVNTRFNEPELIAMIVTVRCAY